MRTPLPPRLEMTTCQKAHGQIAVSSWYSDRVPISISHLTAKQVKTFMPFSSVIRVALCPVRSGGDHRFRVYCLMAPGDFIVSIRCDTTAAGKLSSTRSRAQ